MISQRTQMTILYLWMFIFIYLILFADDTVLFRKSPDVHVLQQLKITKCT